MWEYELFVSIQAYIKLGDYQKALADCDWALKVRFPSHVVDWVVAAATAPPVVSPGAAPFYMRFLLAAARGGDVIMSQGRGRPGIPPRTF